MKATYQSSTDVALVKYWGKKDEALRLPENGSLSMVLDGLNTTTTVEFRDDLKADQVVIQMQSDPKEAARVSEHLDRIRQLAGVTTFARVESINRFPKGTGLSSSGSGFAALTCAAARALDLKLGPRELSILARFASGTACRCICGGFVEWHDGDTSETSYSETVFPASHWDLRDVIAVVGEGMKRVSSTQGHKLAQSSAFFAVRKQKIRETLREVKACINERDFTRLGETVEAEALEFHSILLTSRPAVIAWQPGTLQVMLEVQAMRRDGIPAYFTINTGFNVHILTLPAYVELVMDRIQRLSMVQKILTARVGDAPHELSEHLF
ncbi:MAG: diphosphomevalonate decarboxylase [Anaerolineae bacterium]